MTKQQPGQRFRCIQHRLVFASLLLAIAAVLQGCGSAEEEIKAERTQPADALNGENKLNDEEDAITAAEQEKGLIPKAGSLMQVAAGLRTHLQHLLLQKHGRHHVKHPNVSWTAAAPRKFASNASKQKTLRSVHPRAA
mmetsp:Transcript_16666/g.29117  ORF Transcript_16666/g.29117 Transcript_16666/m.29117 type:complete len:138 (+) Transcript_16666:111-524(+)